MANKNLNAAKAAKKDEFYTQLRDIEMELKHYWPHFKDKVVLCNCDDPYESNFFKYFALLFNQLGLKKLICTCYNGSPVQGNELMIDFGDLSSEPKKIAYKVEITEVRDLNGDGAVDLSDVKILLQNDKNVCSTLKTGDFRDPECIELLKEADIVVTNPPFSLFREYIGQLLKYEKKFLIMGSQNNISYKEVFPQMMNNKIWLGYKSGHTWFQVPDYYEIPDFYDLNDTNRLRSNGYAYKEGKLWRNLGNICWFTNLDIQKRHEIYDLVCHYSPEEYPKYDNYDAIEVSKVETIPDDYDGVMGVPITFLDKYNPDQFEILGITDRGNAYGLKTKEYSAEDTPNANDLNRRAAYLSGGGYFESNLRPSSNSQEIIERLRIPGFEKYDRPYINGVRKYARILIRNKHPKTI